MKKFHEGDLIFYIHKLAPSGGPLRKLVFLAGVVAAHEGDYLDVRRIHRLGEVSRSDINLTNGKCEVFASYGAFKVRAEELIKELGLACGSECAFDLLEQAERFQGIPRIFEQFTAACLAFEKHSGTTLEARRSKIVAAALWGGELPKHNEVTSRLLREVDLHQQRLVAALTGESCG